MWSSGYRVRARHSRRPGTHGPDCRRAGGWWPGSTPRTSGPCSLAWVERLLGPDHSDTLLAWDSLAAAYRDAGRVSEAVPLLELILAGRERRLAAEHPRTLAARDNLAAAYQAAGRSAEAIPLLEQNLARCERLLGPGHPRTLAARINLAAANHAAGRAG